MTEHYERFLQLRRMISFGSDDVDRLVAMRPLFEEKGHGLTDSFYEVLLNNPDTAAVIGDRVESLKKTHARWLLSLCGGEYDRVFFDTQFRIGTVHVEQSVPPWFVSVVMNVIRVEAGPLIASEGTVAESQLRLASFLKVVDLVGMVMDMGYAEARLRRIATVTRMSRELILDLVEGDGADRPAVGFL